MQNYEKNSNHTHIVEFYCGVLRPLAVEDNCTLLNHSLAN